MVDRVYKGAIPDYRRQLERMRSEFRNLPSSTDWNRLRVEPLLGLVQSLDGVLRSKRHSAQVARLTRGVSMFHSDLVYLRHNLRELEKTLERERRYFSPSKTRREARRSRSRGS